MTNAEKEQIATYIANINRAFVEIKENIDELEKDLYD